MKIGEALVKANLITEDQLQKVLEQQERTHERIGDIVIKMGLVTPEVLAPVLAKFFHIPFVPLKEIYKNIQPEVIDLVPLELAQRFTIIPLEVEDKYLTVAMFDPLDLVAIDTLQLKLGYKIRSVVAVETEITEAIDYCYHNLPRLKESVASFIDTEIDVQPATEEDTTKQFDASDKPVVQYVKSLIVQGINSRASDIILDPKMDTVDLRFRIDGVLHQIDPPPKAMLSAINARIKILSGLDIAERRLPKDGRFRVKVGNTEVDVRTSTFPTIYGESIVLRLLDTSHPLLGLEQLGFEKDDLKKYRELLGQPYGLILVTGPTGSGKTTTLYTSLNELKSTTKNILTLEDPVEYRLPFIKQSQINPQIGFTFASGLRSMLRQDPDVIMVGEIRDRETAEIAIHAALTGHLVLSTLHTNDASGAPVRLINMGIEPYLITSSLLGVVAQRLIRVICPHCHQVYKIDQGMWDKIPFSQELTSFCRGNGCEQCFRSGYKGRMGIYEILMMDQEISNCILACSSSEEIRKVAQKNGMRTLKQIGIEKIQQGVTSPEEVLRITQKASEG